MPEFAALIAEAREASERLDQLGRKVSGIAPVVMIPAQRELLRRVEKRARAAGLQPVAAYF